MRIALALAAAALAACSQVPKAEVDPDSGRVDVDVERPGQAEMWTASLTGVAGSGVTGTAGARVTDDMTHGTVSITGAQTGAAHPWHIHEGRCGDSGPIVGPATAYPVLRVGGNGRASAEAHLPNVELNEAKSYYVNVHASPANLGVIVSCGALDD
ncbi:MAG TPA: CHRD domain-containing protein [Longimicrobiaceae bacterium]|nr:CHRD domain-containing protein [Longimicrobiaceae bacterium]